MMRLSATLLTTLMALLLATGSQAATSNVCLPLYTFEYGDAGWYYYDAQGVKQTDLWRSGVGVGGGGALKIPSGVSAIHHDNPSSLPGGQLCFLARPSIGGLGPASAIWTQDNQDFGCSTGCFTSQYPPRPPCPSSSATLKPVKVSGLSGPAPPVSTAYQLYQFPTGLHHGPDCVMPLGATLGIDHLSHVYIDNIGVMYSATDCLGDCLIPADCDDQDPCTQDQCLGGQCLNTPIAGCCKDASDCDDGELCTIDQCLPNGTCHHIPRPTCCSEDSECDDGSPCTIDTCENHACVNLAGCDDGLDCTQDTCDPDSGACDFVPSSDACAAPEDPCVSVSCVAGEGCVEEATDCDDGLACTLDSCEPGQGCVHEETCDDGDPCTDDHCSDNGQCVATPNTAPCDDGDACTGGSPAPCTGRVTISTNGKCLFGTVDGPPSTDAQAGSVTTGGCGSLADWELTLHTGGQYSVARTSASGDDFCLSAAEGGPSLVAETPCMTSGVWSDAEGTLWHQRWDIIALGDGYRIQRGSGLQALCVQQTPEGIGTGPCSPQPSFLDTWTILGPEGEPCTYEDQCADGVCGGVAEPLAGDSCDNAIALNQSIGTMVYEGTLECLADESAMLCGGAESPEAIYALTLHDPMLLSARVLSSHDTVLYITSSCEATDAPCADETGLGQAELVEAVFEPGLWFIVVDGASGTLSGGYSLELTLSAVAPTHPLSVEVIGSGHVESMPAGIMCGLLCQADFEEGSFVTLEAQGFADAPFLGWVGGGCDDLPGPCVVEMTSAQQVVARFGEVPTPELVVTQHPPAVTALTSATFDFESNISDPLYTCQLDDAVSEPCTPPVTFSDLAEGPHTFLVRATRPDDGAQASEAITWTVDLSAPNTFIVSGPEVISWSDEALIEFSADEAEVTFTCRHEGPQGAGPWFPCATPLSITELLPGWHTLSVYATDIAGNVDLTPAQVTWQARILDTTILDGPPAFTAASLVSFSLQSSEPNAALYYALDDGPATSTGPELVFEDVALGPHTLEVWSELVVNGELLVDDTPATWSWTQVSPEPTCGNGIVEGEEACDDANTEDGDACSADCKTDCDLDDDEVIAQACGGEDCNDEEPLLGAAYPLGVSEGELDWFSAPANVEDSPIALTGDALPLQDLTLTPQAAGEVFAFTQLSSVVIEEAIGTVARFAITAGPEHAGGAATFQSRDYTQPQLDAPEARPPRLVLSCNTQEVCKVACPPAQTLVPAMADAHVSAVLSDDVAPAAGAPEGLAPMLAVNATSDAEGKTLASMAYLAFDLRGYSCDGVLGLAKLELSAGDWPEGDVTLSLYALPPGQACVSECDKDGDEELHPLCGGLDCDDSNAEVNPAAEELCGDGKDNDCDPETSDVCVDPCDVDDDGYVSLECQGGTDCDDNDPTVYPGAPEICGDGKANDCGDPSPSTCQHAGSHKVNVGAAAQLLGAYSDGRLGMSFSPSGDLNGDDAPDILLGAPADLVADATGRAYVVRGGVEGVVTLAVNHEAVLGSMFGLPGAVFGAGLTVNRLTASAPVSVAIGAPLHATVPGETQCSAGRISIFDGPFEGNAEPRSYSEAAHSITGTDYLAKAGCYDDLIGLYLDAGTDLNGDGKPDLVTNSKWLAGGDKTAAYVTFGPMGGQTQSLTSAITNPPLSLSSLSLPTQVVHLGDINGDGHADLGLAYTRDSTQVADGGALYIMYGPLEAGATLSVEAAGVVLRGAEAGMRFGAVAQGSMSVADVTGDGVDDLLVTAAPEGLALGAYVFAGPILESLSTNEASAFFSGSDAQRPTTIASAGDFNGDGIGDLVIGAPSAPTAGEGGGAAYVFYGPITGGHSLSEADASFTGIQAGALVGQQVGSPGDLNGDGVDDLIITAPGFDPQGVEGADAGAAYVWHGRGQ